MFNQKEVNLLFILAGTGSLLYMKKFCATIGVVENRSEQLQEVWDAELFDSELPCAYLPVPACV